MSSPAVARARSTALPACATAAAVGTVAMVCADMVHEALGHGTACWLTGNRIVSLSTVAIQTAAPSHFVSAAGTTTNCIAGALSLLLFGRLKRLTASTWFWWLFGVFNLMNSGYLVASAVMNTADWARVIEGLEPNWMWRCILALGGLAVYVLSVKWSAGLLIRRFEAGELGLPDLQRLTLPAYLAAGVVMSVAAIFNPIGPALIIPSGVAPSFGLNAGLLFIPRIVEARVGAERPAPNPMGLSFAWIALAVLSAAVFVAVLGPGIQF